MKLSNIPIRLFHAKNERIQKKEKKKNEKENRLLLLDHNVECGENVVINGRLHMVGNGKVSIGRGTVINSGGKYNPSAGEASTYINLYGGDLCIGSGVGISNAAITVAIGVKIGDRTNIGSGCIIADTDFHPVGYEDRINGRDEATGKKPVTIGEGVFVGARSIILKGVTVGDRSVIGAGSVVTKSIPEDELWAGNPAVFIRKLNGR